MITFRLKSVFLLLMSSFLLVSCTNYTPTHWDIAHAASEWKHQPVEKIYAAATRNHKNDEYSLAMTQYQVLIKLHPSSQYAPLARIALIDCYRANRQFEQAIQIADEFMHLYPNNPDALIVKRIKRAMKHHQYTINKYDMFGLYPYWGGFTPYGYILGCLCVPILPPILLIRLLFVV